MAKVTVEIDTEKQSVEVKVGKKKIDNVSDIWINTEEGGFFNLEISQRSELDGLRQHTRLMASVNDEEWQEKEDEVDHKGIAQLLLRREIS